MSAKPFSFIKESLAADKPATAQAAGAAMCAEIYEFPKKQGGRDLTANEAHRIVALVSLGKKTILFRHGNRAEERLGAIDELSVILKNAKHRNGRRKVPFDVVTCRCIAGVALAELAIDMCPACMGAGQVRMTNQTEGRQPMMACPTCSGKLKRVYKEDERVDSLAAEWLLQHPQEPEEKQTEIRRAIAKDLRAHPKLSDLTDAIDYAKKRLIEAERVATEETARMLERWGVT